MQMLHHGSMKRDICYFAQTNWRREHKAFGILDDDRLLHIHVLGKTGTGKSSMIKTMICQDIIKGNGCALFDPHGDLIEAVLEHIPEDRNNDLVYLNLSDTNLAYGYNPLKRVLYEQRALLTSGMLEVFKKLWNDAWGVRLEHILRNVLLSLLDLPKTDLRDIPRMLLDRNFRNNVIAHVKNPAVREFWKLEFPQYTREALTPVLNKIGGMLSYPVIRRFLIENEKKISLRNIMDEEKILLVNLSKGHIGEDVANIIGSFLVHSIGLAGMTRVNLEEDERKPFYVYVDEFQNFATLSFINFLSELRKFKIGFLLAHQYLFQLDIEIAKAVIGNVGSSINFRLGADDAHYLAKAYIGTFEAEDFLYLPNYHIYLSLMIKGQASRGFSAITLQYPFGIP